MLESQRYLCNKEISNLIVKQLRDNQDLTPVNVSFKDLIRLARGFLKSQLSTTGASTTVTSPPGLPLITLPHRPF